MFSIDTQWLLPTEVMMLRTEHSGLAGNFEIDETPGGLYVHGTILGGLRGSSETAQPVTCTRRHRQRPPPRRHTRRQDRPTP